MKCVNFPGRVLQRQKDAFVRFSVRTMKEGESQESYDDYMSRKVEERAVLQERSKITSLNVIKTKKNRSAKSQYK